MLRYLNRNVFLKNPHFRRNNLESEDRLTVRFFSSKALYRAGRNLSRPCRRALLFRFAAAKGGGLRYRLRRGVHSPPWARPFLRRPVVFSPVFKDQSPSGFWLLPSAAVLSAVRRTFYIIPRRFRRLLAICLSTYASHYTFRVQGFSPERRRPA